MVLPSSVGNAHVNGLLADVVCVAGERGVKGSSELSRGCPGIRLRLLIEGPVGTHRKFLIFIVHFLPRALHLSLPNQAY